MEPGFFYIIGNADFRIGKLCQFLDGLGIRGAHVRCREDPQSAASLGETLQLRPDHGIARELDEGYQKVDPVR